MLKKNLIVRQFGFCEYNTITLFMYTLTKKRTPNTLDELWLLEHYPVFTQGQTGQKKHVLEQLNNIPLIYSNRGGQITYHGPGQQIMYILLDLKRNKISIRNLIIFLEKTIINTLKELNISSYTRRDAPGVYIKKKKICSIGLRIHKGCSLHGLAFNINMDLTPFNKINPCGFVGMQMTHLHEFIPNIQVKDIEHLLIKHFCSLLNFQPIQ